MALHSPVNPKDFWERKIIDWEIGRYGLSEKNEQTFFEKIADKSSNSLRQRLQLASQYLAPFVDGKRVLEVGCGSGLLTPYLMDAGAKSYLGIDIASVAIKKAEERYKDSNWVSDVEFRSGSMDQIKGYEFDIVVSLGLTDWLGEQEMTDLFSLSDNCDCFHSISENRFSISQLIHRLYVNVAYGYKTGGYKPKYYSEKEILSYTSQARNPCSLVRHPTLKFGAFVSSLPIKQTL